METMSYRIKDLVVLVLTAIPVAYLTGVGVGAAKNALEEANVACLTMHNDTVRFTNHVNSILETINEHELYDIQEQLEASVVAAFQQIAQTSVELGIQIDFQAMVNPEWMSAVQSDFDPASELES